MARTHKYALLFLISFLISEVEQVKGLWARDFLWEKLVFQQAAAAKRAFLLPAFLLTAARRLSKCSDTTVHCLAPFFSRQDYGGKNSLTFQSHFPLYVK